VRVAAVDPVLAEQLERLGSGEVLDAILVLRPLGSASGPDDVRRVAHDVVSRAAGDTGHAAQKVVVFPNLRSFLVRAERPLLTRLLDQSEIASASPGSGGEMLY
jgi:hypothetical protein